MFVNVLKNTIIKYGTKMCALAIMLAPMGVNSCRCQFYEPEEPEDLKKYLSDRSLT